MLYNDWHMTVTGPDGKTQVTVEYRDGRPVRADYIVIAASHTPDVVTRDD